MISVADALTEILALTRPVGTEEVALAAAGGRVLRAPVLAGRDQPPFASSAMDGYAVAADAVRAGAAFDVIGTSAAGHGFDGALGPGEAVRIFTGAPVPEGAGHVIIQEDVHREGDRITLRDGYDRAAYIRPAGMDFTRGDAIAAPRVLGPTDLALAAAMNAPRLSVSRRPVVALMATGDELVMPGDVPGPDQIIASNSFGLKARFEGLGAEVRMLPIARDNRAALMTCFDLAADADLIVTLGGASVGDHDLVGPVARERGMEQAFYKVAMRPGKPLMAGRFGDAVLLGLPGNPVSSLVCGEVFGVPAIRALLGLEKRARQRQTARLEAGIGPNGGREHYMRARLSGDRGLITPMARQDSSLLSVMAGADALMIRPPDQGPCPAGSPMEYIPL